MASTKYYAVRVGRNPGIYTSWNECQKQVQGFSDALYKSFTSLDEANAYIYGASPTTTNDGKHYDIYVDGSFIDNNYSWAFVVYEDSKMIYQHSGIGQNAEAAVTRNIAGELEAAMQAVAWAISQNIDYITIHHDYTGISEWAYGSWKANNFVTQYYVQFMAPYLDRIRFNKVSGHTGIGGNELADKLARNALLGKNFA